MTDSFKPLVPLANLSAQNPFLIAAFIDESGSMHVHKDEVLDSLNRFIAEQRKVKTPTVLHLSMFCDTVRHVYRAQPLDLVVPLRPDQYNPDGGMALFDAVGAGLDGLIRGHNPLLVLVVTRHDCPGWANARLSPGKPKAHFTLILGTSAALSPGSTLVTNANIVSWNATGFGTRFAGASGGAGCAHGSRSSK